VQSNKVQVTNAMQNILSSNLFNIGQFFIDRKKVKNSSDRLFTMLNSQARNIELFGHEKIEDTPDGRFEAFTLFGAAVISGLPQRNQIEVAISKELHNRIFKTFDQGLRELGTGDMVVGKRIRKLAESFYGRAISYGQCFVEKDIEKLSEKIALNVFGRTEICAFDKVLASKSMSFFEDIRSVDFE